MYVSVIGAGYLGAVHAVGLAELGHVVVGVDTDACKVAALREGGAPIFEPGLDELLRKHTESGQLRFTTEYAETVDAEVYFICVGTPQRRDGIAADLTYVEAAVDTLAPHLTRRCRGAGVVLHLTEWPEFREIAPAELGTVVAQRNVVDGRNCLDSAAWRRDGWTYRGLGNS